MFAHSKWNGPRSSDLGASTLMVAASLLAALLACKQGDPAKCTEAQATIRKAVESRDFDGARQWREHAYKICDDKGPLAAVDKEITDAEAKVKKEAEEAAAKKAKLDAVVKAFTGFVATSKDTADKAGADVKCEDDKAKERSKERWCTSKRRAGEITFDISYWEKDPKIAKFQATIPGPVVCEDIAGTVKVKYPYQGTEAQQCALGGALGGMEAWAAKGSSAPLIIYAPKYAEQHSGFKKFLETR